MTRKFCPLSIFVLLSFLFLSPTSLFAQGDLMMMPKRLVFDGSQRSQEVNLANTGKDTAIYAISFINYKMTETGSFEQIETPEDGQKFATDFLRYFPRRVTLAPNESQTVRVQLTRTGNLEEGEYRSHMYFRAVDEQVALGEENSKSSDGISIQIKTVFGISIPVIIRHGKSEITIGLSECSLNLNEEIPVLSMILNRTGNMSVYGDIKVEHISKDNTVTTVGLVKGISVYTPNSRRQFSMKLNKAEGIDLSNGKLKITYQSDSNDIFSATEMNL